MKYQVLSCSTQAGAGSNQGTEGYDREELALEAASMARCNDCCHALDIAGNRYEVACTAWVEYRSREALALCRCFVPRRQV